MNCSMYSSIPSHVLTTKSISKYCQLIWGDQIHSELKITGLNLLSKNLRCPCSWAKILPALGLQLTKIVTKDKPSCFLKASFNDDEMDGNEVSSALVFTKQTNITLSNLILTYCFSIVLFPRHCLSRTLKESCFFLSSTLLL